MVLPQWCRPLHLVINIYWWSYCILNIHMRCLSPIYLFVNCIVWFRGRLGYICCLYLLGLWDLVSLLFHRVQFSVIVFSLADWFWLYFVFVCLSDRGWLAQYLNCLRICCFLVFQVYSLLSFLHFCCHALKESPRCDTPYSTPKGSNTSP